MGETCQGRDESMPVALGPSFERSRGGFEALCESESDLASESADLDAWVEARESSFECSRLGGRGRWEGDGGGFHLCRVGWAMGGGLGASLRVFG